MSSRPRIPRAAIIAAAWGVLAASAAASSCSLTTDLAGLSGGGITAPADGAAIADAATDTSSASDTGTSDAGVEGGAGSDGGDGGDGGEAGTTSPCGAVHAFCADFDNGAVANGWTLTALDAPGTLVLDDLALSPLHSMRARQPRKTTSGALRSSLRKSLASQWRRAIFQADAYLVQPMWLAGDTNVAVAQLGYNSQSGNSGTTLFTSAASSAGTIEHLTDMNARIVTVKQLPNGRWFHVVIDFDPAGKIHYEIDGSASERTFTAVTAGGSPELLLELGIIDYNNPIPAIDIRWDNVVVDLP